MSPKEYNPPGAHENAHRCRDFPYKLKWTQQVELFYDPEHIGSRSHLSSEMGSNQL